MDVNWSLLSIIPNPPPRRSWRTTFLRPWPESWPAIAAASRYGAGLVFPAAAGLRAGVLLAAFEVAMGEARRARVGAITIARLVGLGWSRLNARALIASFAIEFLTALGRAGMIVVHEPRACGRPWMLALARVGHTVERIRDAVHGLQPFCNLVERVYKMRDRIVDKTQDQKPFLEAGEYLCFRVSVSTGRVEFLCHGKRPLEAVRTPPLMLSKDFCAASFFPAP